VIYSITLLIKKKKKKRFVEEGKNGCRYDLLVKDARVMLTVMKYEPFEKRG
jgi:hypothetical protein